MSIDLEEYGMEVSWGEHLLVITAIMIAASYCLFRKKFNHHAKKQLFKNKCLVIPTGKIIVAVQIIGLLIEYTNRWKYSFREAKENTSENWVYKWVKRCCGFGHFFREMFPPKMIRKFLKELRDIKKVELFLCTSLTQEVGEQIINYYQLQTYFPTEYRKFNDAHSELYKHAIDVDKDTRRVIILTPNAQDLCDQNEKYFWLIHPTRSEEFLKKTINSIRDLVETNEDIDGLHEELAQLKIDEETNRS